jgi:hypothetical protein
MAGASPVAASSVLLVAGPLPDDGSPDAWTGHQNLDAADVAHASALPCLRDAGPARAFRRMMERLYRFPPFAVDERKDGRRVESRLLNADLLPV